MTPLKMIRKISPLVGSAGLFIFPLTSFAAITKITQLVQKTQTIIEMLVVIVFSVAVLVFGWGIVKYLTAAGDSAKIKEARVFLWWGVIGMFVLAAVFGIIRFIADQLGISAVGGQTIFPPKVE